MIGVITKLFFLTPIEKWEIDYKIYFDTRVLHPLQVYLMFLNQVSGTTSQDNYIFCDTINYNNN